MKSGKLIVLACLAFVCQTSCIEESGTQFPELDLMSYGMPIVIHAPENSQIKSMDLVMSQDITVINGKDFNVQIFESVADVRDVQEIKKRLIEEVRNGPYFKSILKEDIAGFLYETQVDSHYVNFGFRHVRIQGDKEYVFQQGLGGKFSREAIETMYSAVQ